MMLVPEEEIWELLRSLLPVLQFIHENNIIHRDIKPSNIIRRDRDQKLFLIDFGIAKLITGTALLKTGTLIGSPEYMSPEQNRGKAVMASDLYSLGVTCINLLTGVPPLDMFDINNDCWVWRNFLLPGHQVSDRLGKILDKLLQSAISKRYKSAVEVLNDINPPKVVLPQPLAPQPQPLAPQPLPPPQPESFLVKIFPNFKQKPDVIISEIGINYQKLTDLLNANKWQSADEETWMILCQAVDKPLRGYLAPDNIEHLPCEDLLILDHLWLKFSKGRFGFSVQKQIFESVNQDYGRFCKQVGWSISLPHYHTTGMIYNLKAPKGHLPSRVWVQNGSQWWNHASAIAKKLESCTSGNNLEG